MTMQVEFRAVSPVRGGIRVNGKEAVRKPLAGHRIPVSVDVRAAVDNPQSGDFDSVFQDPLCLYHCVLMVMKRIIPGVPCEVFLVNEISDSVILMFFQIG